MINKKLIDVFLTTLSKEELIKGINILFNHFKIDSDYNYETRINNFINILADNKSTTIEDIDINLLKENIKFDIYKGDQINKDSIKIIDIDPLDETIKISFNKINNEYPSDIILQYYKYLKTVK